MAFAINDKTGEILMAGPGGQWSPAPRAQNDKGETLVFDGSAWGPMPGGPAAPQMGAGERLGKMAASEAGKGFLTSYGLPMDLAQGAYNLLGKYVTTPAINAVRSAVGQEPGQFNDVSLPGSSANIVSAAKDAGLVDRPDLQPQSTGERYLASTARGVGAAAPFAPLAGPAVLMQGAGAGLAQQGGRDALDKTTLKDNPYAKAAVDVGASLAGGYAGGKVADGVTRAFNAAFGNLNELGQAYQRTGVTPRIPAAASGSTADQGLLAYTAKSPGSAGTVQKEVQATLDDFGAAVERQAGRLGTSRTPQEAGAVLQGGATQWLDNWRKSSSDAWNVFWSKVPPEARSDMPNTRALLSGADTAMAKEMPELAKALQDQTIAKLAATVGSNAQPVSGQVVREFRSAIGDKVAAAPMVGEDAAALKRLYGALTEDIKALARQAGGEPAVAAFENANAITRTGHNLIETTVGNLIGHGTRKINPEQAASWALSHAGGKAGGGTQLSNVKTAVGPEAMDELAGLDLRQRATALPGNQVTGGETSPARMVSQFAPQNLAPEARSILYQNAPSLPDLLRVGGSIKESGKLANTSNTGPYGQMVNLTDRLAVGALGGGATGGAIGGVSGGVTGAALGTAAALSPLAINRLLGELSTSKTMARLLMARGANVSGENAALAAALASRAAPEANR